MNGTLAVARYTLLELSRRRILLVFFVIGAAGLALLAILLKVFSSAFVGQQLPGSAATPAMVDRLVELTFVSILSGVLGLFALLIAIGIGMTAIYHDLESGAAVGIFSKPVSRLAFTVGKLGAAIAALIVIFGLLSLESRLAMFLFGGGLESALWWETVAGVANALTLMTIVLALSAWMNNIVAAVVAFIYNSVGGVVVSLHQQMTSGNLGDNQVLRDGLNVVYWLVPHALVSAAPREIFRAQYEINSASDPEAPPVDQILAQIPGPSGFSEIVWWLFVVLVLSALLYLAVRRRQV